MSCYGCVTKFSFFTKEHPCNNCGYSFCAKCLKQKATVGNVEKTVCKNCYRKLTEPESTSVTDMETPDMLLKRLETLENPAKPPITIFRHSQRLNNLKYGLSSEDKKILERLEKLKADHTASILPDESEIKRRLRLLQERSVESISDKPQSLDPTPKSQQEEVEDLLKQYMDETGIETNLETRGAKSISDVESRLRKLQMSESSSMSVDPSNMDFEDGDSETARIIKRAIAEGKLEKKLEESMGKEDDSDISDIDQSEPESEYPWCIICNEDAVLKCLGCDGSLYCNPCFKQGHETFNMEDHESVPYQRKDSLS